MNRYTIDFETSIDNSKYRLSLVAPHDTVEIAGLQRLFDVPVDVTAASWEGNRALKERVQLIITHTQALQDALK